MPDAAASNNELVLTREMNVPREKLFRCWTEPALMKEWFAPRPYTTPVVETDARTGGASFIIMRSPDGQDIPLHGVYLEVVKNERIVFTDAYTRGWQPSAKPFFTGIITFADEGGRTRLTMRSLFPTAAARDYVVREFKAIEGGNQTLDRLGEYLGKR